MPRWPLFFLADAPRGRRFRWPLAVLLVSIGLTAIAAIEAQRTLRSQHAVAERALREYANFAAWSYAQHLTDTLAAIEQELVGSVNHGKGMHVSPEVPDAQDLEFYLPHDSRCDCHTTRAGPVPENFFAFKIGNASLDLGPPPDAANGAGWRMSMDMGMSDDMRMHMDSMRPERQLDVAHVDEASAHERRWIVDSLTRRARGLGRPDHGFTLIIGEVDRRPRVVTYTLMPTAWGDTMVYGGRYSGSSLAGVFAGVLDGRGLLPETFTHGRGNRDIVVIRVRDHTGHSLFDSAPGVESDLAAHVDLPPAAGDLSLDAVIRPEIAGTLIIGGLPASRLPLLLGLLAVAAALSIVAVTQLRREGELAHLRADFVSSVSHELRTPLAQIRLYLDTLRLGRASTEDQRAWTLGHIERETTRLSYLVEKVLRFATLSYDDATPVDPIDAGAEVARVVAEFEPLAASRRASIAIETSPTPPLLVRPEAVRHIVINLLDNAVKYGPADQTVRVTVARQNGSVEIAVSDEGPGVPPAERDRIWRPFMRGGAARNHGGSGIGLTIVRQVAEGRGGAVRVESAAGGGARFVVSLPVEPPPAG
ncbi:MAG TPA: HAMP domain-containing sensor histidine kinase [Gemmatimonadaceae bacterium]|nr:HAMP domain-containing sensor histidine kinase [Gemmatimonadaceae bacterium]